MEQRAKWGRRHRIAARAVCVVLAALLPALQAPDLLAQPADAAALAKARSQFQQALALETAEDWAGALSLFQQVGAIKLTPQVRFHIGLCEEHLGRLAAALGAYKLAAAEAEDAKATEVAAQVAARVGDLSARIPKIVIVRGKGADYAKISLDGVSLGSSAIGDELPVDPGPHNVEARARGFKPFNKTVELAEKEVKKLEIVLAPEAGPEPTPTGPEKTTGPEPTPEQPAPGKRSLVVPLVVGGVGVASLGASGVFFILRGSALSKLEDKCPNRDACPPDLKSTYDAGKTYSLLVPITLGVGVAAVGTAAVLYFTQKPGTPAPAAASLTLQPLVPVGSGAPVGAAISGRF
jgi:PEGA domain